MKNLESVALFKIHDGKLKEFKALAKQCLAIVKEQEENTLRYDWFFNEDNTECVVIEKYTDSNAVFVHLGDFGDLLGQLTEIADLSLEVYGDPSEELKKTIAPMNPKLYSFYQGL